MVTLGDLSRTVRSVAAVARANHQQLGLGAEEGPAVVTASAHSAGARLDRGTVIVEINGRPRFATQGTFPYYRDLAQGSKGPDVRQLQEALGVPADGEFGAGTVRAVELLYRAAGFEPPVASSSPSGAKEGSDRTIEGPSGAVPAAPAMVVPASELIVLNALPSFLVSAPARGSLSPDATIDVESGDFVVRATLPNTVSSELSASVPVTISREGETIPGTLTETAESGDDTKPHNTDRTEGDSTGSSHKTESVSTFLAADGASLDESWRGSRVTVSVVVAVAATESLLAPSVAVVTSKGGNATVQKKMPDGSFRSIPVVERAALDGRSALAAVTPGDLVAGDHVRVG